MNIGGFSEAVFNVISAFLADNNQRFVAEVEAIEQWLWDRHPCLSNHKLEAFATKLNTRGSHFRLAGVAILIL